MTNNNFINTFIEEVNNETSKDHKKTVETYIMIAGYDRLLVLFKKYPDNIIDCLKGCVKSYKSHLMRMNDIHIKKYKSHEKDLIYEQNFIRDLEKVIEHSNLTLKIPISLIADLFKEPKFNAKHLSPMIKDLRIINFFNKNIRQDMTKIIATFLDNDFKKSLKAYC